MRELYSLVEPFSAIPVILEKYRASRVFLVTGDRSFILSGAHSAIAPVLHDYSVSRFSEFSSNPKIEDVVKGVRAFREYGPDFVIAVGGGSVIDMAKLVNSLACQEHVEEDIILGKQNIEKRPLPLVAVPTTAGSGSEATCFAVVYIDNIKYSLVHDYVYPDHAILDPCLTHSLPPALTAVSGFDALGQAIESFWAVESTEESKTYASEAIRVILENIECAVKCPNKGNRESMILGAHLSGRAINISKTTAPHAISYRLSMDFGVPHGHAVGLSLGKILLVNANPADCEVVDPRGREYVEETMSSLCTLLGSSNPEICADRLYALMRKVGLATEFREVGVLTQADVERIIAGVNHERLTNNPVKISEKLLRTLFE